jgi:hypothetical protein
MFNRHHYHLLFGIGVLLLIYSAASAQLAYSPFTEGTVAYVALTGSEINFARGNPAALAENSNHSRFIYSLETNQDHFDSHIQNFGLRLALGSRLTIGVGRWYRTATTGALISCFSNDDPLRWTGFGYRQNWTAGFGVQISQNLAFGVSVRNEEYSASPTDPQLEVSEDYWTSDIGLSYSVSRFNLGIVVRNVQQDHALDASALQIARTLEDGNLFSWNPTDIPGIAFEPERSVEVGASWNVISFLDLIGDITSRAEYALGMRVHPIAAISLTSGIGARYDRIYNEAPVQYAAVGLQFRHQMLTGAVTWIAPLQSGEERIIDTRYGTFEQQQMTNHQLLFGLAIAY